MQKIAILLVAIVGVCSGTTDPELSAQSSSGAPSQLKQLASLLAASHSQAFAPSGQSLAPRKSLHNSRAPAVSAAEPVWPEFFQDYAEDSRKFRRTVYMHDEWVKHRSSDRFFRNMRTVFESGIGLNLGTELTFVSFIAVFVVLANMLTGDYVGLDGLKHAGLLAGMFKYTGAISLPNMPFSVAMPALSLLLVFRTNTAYSRWNEARTLWGGVVNTCRNIARQASSFPDEDPVNARIRDCTVGMVAAFAKALRNFLRGPTDDDIFREELNDLVRADLFTPEQVEACMAAKNRPMWTIQSMSTLVKKLNLDTAGRLQVDTSISKLVDLTGACERIFKSPIPLVYTRHTARFLTIFLSLLPFGLWEVTGGSWNHWMTVPAELVIAFFLFGIEELGVQVEEPFSILPLEALCNGAIAAVMDEMVDASEASAVRGFEAPLPGGAASWQAAPAYAEPAYAEPAYEEPAYEPPLPPPAPAPPAGSFRARYGRGR